MDDIGFVPPQALDVEEAVLGMMINVGDSYDDVADIVHEELFYKENHRKIFKAISILNSNNKQIDMLTVCEQLKSLKCFDEIGGYIKIADLASKISSSAHIETHVKHLADKSIRRNIISQCQEGQRLARDETIDIADILDNTQAKILDIGKEYSSNKEESIGDLANKLVADVYKEHTPNHYVPIHIHELQAKTNGFGGGEMVIIGARPSMGKTALALNLCYEQAKAGYPTAFYSLEMTTERLMIRLASAVTQINGKRISKGDLSEEEKIKLSEFAIEMTSIPMYIEGCSGMSIYQFKAKVRRMVKNKEVACVYLDYIQLMTGNKKLEANRQSYIGDISRQIVQTALELNIPIVALSQLNRAVDNRALKDQLPKLADLRESGDLEQDASIVLFPTRFDRLGLNEYDGIDVEGKALLDMQKNRDGECEPVLCNVSQDSTRWTNLNAADDMPF